MRSYSIIFTILAGLVGVTTIGCTNSPTATVLPSNKSAPIDKADFWESLHKSM